MFKVALTALAALSFSACQDLPKNLPAGDLKSVHYWGDFFLAKYEAEINSALTNIEPGPEPLAEPRTILLITGVTIPAEWMGPIAKRLERDGFRPVIYEPPELLSGSLFEASEELAEVVENVLAESGQDTIDILAECTGGVIARHYVQSLGGDKYIDRLVTFVSPQAGIPKAALAATVARWPALYDLTPGSDFLEAVNNVPLPETLDMTSIYSCTDEYIQPYETSIVEGATNIGLCDGFVGHFETMYDPQIYLIMHNALTTELSFDRGGDDADDKADDLGDANDDSNVGSGCSTSGGAPSTPGLIVLLGAMLVGLGRRRRSLN